MRQEADYGRVMWFTILIEIPTLICTGGTQYIYLTLIPIMGCIIGCIVVHSFVETENRNQIHWALPKTLSDSNPIRCPYSKNIIGINEIQSRHNVK